MRSSRTPDLLWFPGHSSRGRQCGKKATVARENAPAVVRTLRSTPIGTITYLMLPDLFWSGKSFAELGGVLHFA
jgi:hypothetical protein